MLTPINNRVATLRASMYEDDATLFANPEKEDVDTVSVLGRS